MVKNAQQDVNELVIIMNYCLRRQKNLKLTQTQ